MATAVEAIAAPAPGIYEGIPFEAYLSWPYVSNSALKSAAKSMRHYQLRQPMKETDCLRLGTLTHVGRLEPSAVYRRYVVMPDFTKGIVKADGTPAESPTRTKQYRDKVEAWCEEQESSGKIIVTQECLDEMVEMVAALDRNQQARELFTADGPVEVSLVWDDAETGIRCKARLDKWLRRKQIIADLKSTRDAGRFERQIAELGYYRQGAMYIDGIATLTGEENAFHIAAVENETPWCVRCAPLATEAIEQGRDEYTSLLRQLKAAQESGDYPGYESPSEWRLPSWAAKEQPQQLVIGGQKVTL